MPGLPIERSIAHPSALADIVVSKFADHQPLHWQAEIAARAGVTLDRASMGRWVGQIEAIQRYTLRPGKLHTDDTPVGRARARQREDPVTGRFWVYTRDDRRSGSTEPAAVWFDFSSDQRRPPSNPARSIPRHSAGGCLHRLRSAVRERRCS
ncbi:MAG: transposase [Burkholderia sp.]